MNISLFHLNQEYNLRLRELKDKHLQVIVDDKTYDVTVDNINKNEFLLKINGKIHNVLVTSNSNAYIICMNGKNIHIGKKSALHLLGGKSAHTQRREVKTSMPGRIIKLLVEPGEQVQEGQAVLILEAMKMQNEIKSPQPGKIICIGPKSGASVEANALLFIVE